MKRPMVLAPGPGSSQCPIRKIYPKFIFEIQHYGPRGLIFQILIIQKYRNGCTVNREWYKIFGKLIKNFEKSKNVNEKFAHASHSHQLQSTLKLWKREILLYPQV